VKRNGRRAPGANASKRDPACVQRHALRKRAKSPERHALRYGGSTGGAGGAGVYHGAGATFHSVALNDPHWQRLWRCKVPPKIKVFWWRVSHDFITCKSKSPSSTYRANIGVCGFCGNCKESMYHALTQCTFAISFWKSSNLPWLSKSPS